MEAIIYLALSNAGFGHFSCSLFSEEDRETDDHLPDTRASDAATLSNGNFARCVVAASRYKVPDVHPGKRLSKGKDF